MTTTSKINPKSVKDCKRVLEESRNQILREQQEVKLHPSKRVRCPICGEIHEASDDCWDVGRSGMCFYNSESHREQLLEEGWDDDFLEGHWVCNECMEKLNAMTPDEMEAEYERLAKIHCEVTSF